MKKANTNQTILDFETAQWPDQLSFALNIKKIGRSVESVIYKDIEESSEYIIITGFTSLSNLIDLFGSKDFNNHQKIRILIGFEPDLRGRKSYVRLDLAKEIKDYWLKTGLSIMQGGAIIHLIEKINSGLIEFRFRNRLHAKIYIGDHYAVLGSSNFSKNGLTTQDEANIRVEKKDILLNEQCQYLEIKKIAENFYINSGSYNDKIIELLKDLIKQVSWKEALARAIAEVIEGNWLNEYKEILSRLEETKLWPTQWKGLAQAMSILQNQSNVLIADPTGAGKTKLCTAVILSLQHWLYEIGKHYRSESLIICPPLVVSKWADEFKSFKRINHSQRSMGLLSNSSGKNKRYIIQELNLANILILDEAHNYLSPNSNRTLLIENNKADFKILITATPISRKVEDLLRLIALLDIDNLNDEDFEVYKELIFKPYSKDQSTNIDNLRKFVSKFIVRRTKKSLNKEIDKEPHKYLNRLNKACKFPQQNEKTYITQETDLDKKIAEEITLLAGKLKGITYLTSFKLPKFEITRDESLDGYIKKRIASGRALSIYMIRAALRSSHVALIEHIEGSEKAMSFFEFQGKTNSSGDKLGKIDDILQQNNLPFIHKKFLKEIFPDWLTDKALYIEACKQEYTIYSQICELAKNMSGNREFGKVKELIKVSKSHNNIIAFDSTVITLNYLKSIFTTHFPNQKLLVASGSETEKDSQKVLDIFKLDSNVKENYIALCSDKMSESIDLQKASCVFLLDMQSVLRIVEQRIGRVDRMDSMHTSIDIYWPEDSEEYSLKGDNRLIETNDIVEYIYGSNFTVPQALKERCFMNTDTTKDIINEYKEFVDKDESWTGIHDSFQPIIELKEGKNALIEEKLYDQFINVSSEVRTRVSFLSSSSNWCFIALRSKKNRSPSWYFIDNQEIIHSEYQDVCQQLRMNIKNDSEALKWEDSSLKRYIDLFKSKERELLTPKKRRALNVAEHLINMKLKSKKLDSQEKGGYEYLLKIILAKSKEAVDFERLAEEWIQILQPYLKTKRDQQPKKKMILNLDSLRSDYKNIFLDLQVLLNMTENCIIAEDIDKRIAACIIGIGNIE